MVSKEIFETSSPCDYSILNDNKNLLINSNVNNEEVQLKPVKKYQLDIPVTSLTALSDIHLALASSSDSKLRIFELQTKKITTLSGHKEPITFLTKLITEELFMMLNEDYTKL